jgi:Pyridoxamine 5'-phosphate oxidase
MATQFDSLSDRHLQFIAEQQMYFVASATKDGRVNLSPKGLDSLRVLSPNRIAWLNGTGSGNESAAHTLADGRMTLMFCSYVREPLILRLYGRATVHHRADPSWADLVGLFPTLPGARNIFVVDIDLVQTSCGYGVPLYEFTAQRDLMHNWATKKGDDGLAQYQREKNLVSLDGLPTGLVPS